MSLMSEKGKPRLQEAGEICESCLPFWNEQKIPPQRFVSLNKTTAYKEISINICPWCDGDTILKLNGLG